MRAASRSVSSRRHSAMFRRYFQTEEEEGGAGSSGDEEAEAADDLPLPEEVWGQVRHTSWYSRVDNFVTEVR